MVKRPEMSHPMFLSIIILSLWVSQEVVCAGGSSRGTSGTTTYGTYGTVGPSGTYGTDGVGFGGGGPAYSNPPGGYGGKPGVADKGYQDSRGPDGYEPRDRGVSSEVCEKFVDKTAALRREFEVKRFDYQELKRDPKSKPEDLARSREEVRALWRNIQGENSQNCRWQE